MERNNLVKASKSGYDIEQIKTIWWVVLKILMRYFSMDGRCTRVFVDHFMLMNHFGNKVKKSFPFYFLSSINATIKDHRKYPNKNLVLHEGSLLLIYEHCKSLPSPSKIFPIMSYEPSSEEEDSSSHFTK